MDGNIPSADIVNEHLRELADWNNMVISDLYTYQTYAFSPYNTTVSGEVEHEKTTLRYEGYVTTQDGQTIEYKEEKVFDFALCSDEALFNNWKTA